VGFSSTAFAQLKPSIGIQGGTINSKFFGDQPDEAAYFFDWGYRVGGQVNIPVANDVFISIEPTFLDERGLVKVLVEPEPDSVFFIDSLEISIKSLSFPLLAKIITKNEKWHFTGGLEILFPLTLTDNSKDFKRNERLRTANVSMEFGFAYRFPMKNWGRFILELRYSQGLVPITDEQEPVISDLKSTRASFMLSYLLPVFQKSKE
jgi:hypothetical protein